MKALDRLGMLKMDFLGLTTLTVLDDAVKLIEQNRGEKIDLSALPLDDVAIVPFVLARRHHRHLPV